MGLFNLVRSLAKTVLPSILTVVIFQNVAFAAADDGSTLPFAPAPSASIAKPRLQDSTMRRRVEKDHLPKDAPNIVIILLDDVGFGLPDTYGGPIHTPSLSRVADEGIVTTPFTRHRFVRRRGRRCSPDATTSAWAPAPSPSARSIGTATRA